MKKASIWLMILPLLLLISSCYKDKNITGEFSDEFYLHHQGADLPIRIRGNANAKTFILFLHGGPFDSAVEHAVYGHFEPLYEDYALVFFDQRGGGYAHGQQLVGLNEEQFVEDVEVVHSLIQQKYPQAENIFLMGHSYGGYLGTAVLKKGENQNLYKGWIELAGAHNFPLNWLASRDFCINYIQQKVDDGASTKNWNERLESLQNTTEITNLDELRVVNGTAFAVASELNDGKNTFIAPSWLKILSSPVGAGFSQHHLDKLEDMLVNGNQNPGMSAIVLPSLLIYGGEDPIVPTATGKNGLEYLGTPEEDKQLIILEKSGHSLWEFEQDIFFQEVKRFISTYE